jgi:hypothetical protein
MRLAEDDEMVNALAPDRPDQPFGKAVLPRRRWCSRLPDLQCCAFIGNCCANDEVLAEAEKERKWGARSATARKAIRTAVRTNRVQSDR